MKFGEGAEWSAGGSGKIPPGGGIFDGGVGRKVGDLAFFVDFDDGGAFDFFLFKGESEDAVVEFGFDVFFVDLGRDGDSAGEITPVALLEVPANGFFVAVGIIVAEGARNGQDVVGNGDVEVVGVDAGGAGLDDNAVGGFVNVHGELAWKFVSIFPPIIPLV